MRSRPAHPRQSLSRLVLLIVLLLLLGGTILGIWLLRQPSPPPSPIEAFLPRFQAVWSRADKPVAEGAARRDWVWGPTPLQTLEEPYAEAPDGERLVQYFAKGRLEVSPTGTDEGAEVTAGLLAQEMINGTIRVGAEAEVPWVPADTEVLPGVGITYQALGAIQQREGTEPLPDRTGQPVQATVDASGLPLPPEQPSVPVVVTEYVPETGRNLPDVFWNYLNSSGTILADGELATGPLVNWRFVYGLPLTDPYWVRSGDSLALVQAFQRRVLVYVVPGGDSGGRVEVPNTGEQYYAWRYAPTAGVMTRSATSTEAVLANHGLRRVVTVRDGALTTTSLVNSATGTEYVQGARPAFVLRFVTESGALAELSSAELTATAVETPIWSAQRRQVRVRLEGRFRDQPLRVNAYYEAAGGNDFLQSWIEIEPVRLTGWSLREAILEDLALQGALQPAAPVERFPLYLGAPPVLDDPGQQVTSAEQARAVAASPSGREGIYFFTASLFGAESFAADDGLLLTQEDYVALDTGWTSGQAVLGGYAGPPEIGFQRYNRYVLDQYSVLKTRKMPVYFSTWMPFEQHIDQSLLLKTLSFMKQQGYFDILHVDAGWEEEWPLQVTPSRFPQGLEPVARQARADGLALGLWINPFSYSYPQYVSYREMHRAHPEWHIQDLEWTDQAGDVVGPFCPNSPYFDYVMDHLPRLVQDLNVKLIYWDGADWNLPPCPASPLDTRSDDELRIAATKRMAALTERLHQVQPDIVIVLWSEPVDIHRLAYVEQNQFTDIWGPPIIESELLRRQLAYYISVENPYYAFWSDWYGISYRGNDVDNYALPLRTLRYANLSVLGNGSYQAGGSIDYERAPPELLSFLQRMFQFRARFARYFTVYQHVLGFPDGTGVDGEGHLLGNSGFIMLNNPTEQALTVDLPLDAPELELSPHATYQIYDWSNLEQGRLLGETRRGESFPIRVPGLGIRIIGVNVGP